MNRSAEVHGPGGDWRNWQRAKDRNVQGITPSLSGVRTPEEQRSASDTARGKENIVVSIKKNASPRKR